MHFTKYLALPREITPFERRYLSRLNKIALYFFYLHVPALVAVAWAAGTGPEFALLLSAAVMVGPTIAYRTLKNPRALSAVYGITAMLTGGLLVHFGQGAVQIEMHFYFFALLAMLCIFANPLVNIAAAVTVALHHLILWLIIPSSVFNYDAPSWVVLVHAVFIVLETVAACYISREYFDIVIGLEKIVEARTATIGEKQRQIRLILDNVESGLITIDLDGRMSSECSRVAEQWFGAPLAGTPMATWLGARDTGYSERLELALDNVRDGPLPREVALVHLPKLLQDQDKTYAVKYQLITHAGAVSADVVADRRTERRPVAVIAEAVPEKILMIITDITERLRDEAVGRHQAELLQLFQHIMRDKTGFIEFLTEAEDIMMSLTTRQYENLDHMKSLVHTLKGNAAIYGMRRVSEICHELENHIAEEGLVPTEPDMAGLIEAWTRTRTDLGNMIGDSRQSALEIDEVDYKAVIKAVLEGVDAKTIVRMIESWRFEPAVKRLARIEQQIKGLAERMGKSHVTVQIEPNDIRFNSERFLPFWSAFIHVLRNTVYHGIEDGEQRRSRGKPEQALIRVTTAIEQNRFVVTVEDDGPGVDWEALRAKASAIGVAASAIDNSPNVIFMPGVSSKASITELSGRGVGMGAVRDACEALGGNVEVKSELGVGTRLRFAFPLDDAIYEGRAMMRGSAVTRSVAA